MNCRLWITNSNCKTKYCASKNALEIVKLQRSGRRGTELAVQNFKRRCLSLKVWSMILIKHQRHRINFSLRAFSSGNNKRQNRCFKYRSCIYMQGFLQQIVQILNRSRIDCSQIRCKVARAGFPSLGFQRELGIMPSKPLFVLSHLLHYCTLCRRLGGTINYRNAIKAEFSSVMQDKFQAMYNYERSFKCVLKCQTNFQKLIT
jgi:hypothetical protein